MRFYFEKHTRKLRSATVAQVMPERSIMTVHKDMTVPEVLRFFEKNKVTDFPVVDDDGELMGDVSIKDILPFAIDPEDISEHEVIGVLGTELHDIFGSSVEDIMKFHEESVSPEAKLEDVALLMWKDDIRCVAVLEGDKPIGVISQQDVIDLIFRTLKDIKIK